MPKPIDVFHAGQRAEETQRIINEVRKPVVDQNGHSGWELETREDVIVHLRTEIAEYLAHLKEIRHLAKVSLGQEVYVQSHNSMLDQHIFELASELGDVWYLLARLSTFEGGIPEEFTRIIQHTIVLAREFGFTIVEAVIDKVDRNEEKYPKDMGDDHVAFRLRSRDEWAIKGGDAEYEVQKTAMHSFPSHMFVPDEEAQSVQASTSANLHAARELRDREDDGATMLERTLESLVARTLLAEQVGSRVY